MKDFAREMIDGLAPKRLLSAIYTPAILWPGYRIARDLPPVLSLSQEKTKTGRLGNLGALRGKKKRRATKRERREKAVNMNRGRE